MSLYFIFVLLALLCFLAGAFGANVTVGKRSIGFMLLGFAFLTATLLIGVR